MPKVEVDKIIFDAEDWLSGHAPGHGEGNRLTIGPGLAFSKNMNPFRLNIGSASPGGNPTEATGLANLTSGTILSEGAIVRDTASTTTMYMVERGSGGKLQAATISNGAMVVRGGGGDPFPRTMTAHGGHAGPFETISIHNYYIGTSLRTFYIWQDDTDADMGVIVNDTIGSETFTDAFLTSTLGGTALTRAIPHPMITGDDGNMYIGNGDAVDRYNGRVGANGTYTSNVFLLPPGFQVQSLSKDSTRNLLVIFATRPTRSTDARLIQQFNGESYAFFWDYASPHYFLGVDLLDNYVSGGFIYDSVPGCFTWGRGSDFETSNFGKLKLYDGRKFQTLARFRGNAPGNGGVDTFGDLIIWNDNGRGWMYGPAQPGFPSRLFQFGQGTGVGGDSGGLIKAAFQNDIWIASRTGSPKLELITKNYIDEASMETLTVEPILPVNKRAKAQAVKVYFAGTATSGRELELSLITDGGSRTVLVYDGVTTVQDTGVQTLTTKNIITNTYRTASDTNLPEFSDIKLKAEWKAGGGATAAPKISRVEVYYKPTNIIDE